MDPAVGRLGTELFAPVALLDGVSAHTDLALLGDHHLAAVVRTADRVVALLARVGRAADAQLAGVHGAVEDANPGPGPVLPAGGQVGRHRGAGDGCDPGPAEGGGVQGRRLQEPEDIGGNADQHRRAVLGGQP